MKFTDIYNYWSQLAGNKFKVPGDDLEDSFVLSGVMVNKDVTHPRMRR